MKDKEWKELCEWISKNYKAIVSNYHFRVFHMIDEETYYVVYKNGTIITRYAETVCREEKPEQIKAIITNLLQEVKI